MDLSDDRVTWMRTGDRAHWLGRCAGFQVVEGDRDLGAVQYVKYRTSVVQPDVIAICGGLLGARKWFVRAEDVDAIDPVQKVVFLHPGAERFPAGYPPRMIA